MRSKKLIIIIIIVVVLIAIGIWYYNKNKKETIEISSTERLAPKCVPDCASTEICIKGACVEKEINKPISL